MKYLLILFIFFSFSYSFDAFIKPADLRKSLSNENLILIDADSVDLYRKSHILSAIHSDVTLFIDKKSKYSNMHSPEIIQKQIQKLGINTNSKVVIYSHNTESGILNTSYLAFILISHGFENVSILDGGYMAWVFENELLISIKRNKKDSGNFTIKPNYNLLADLEYVQNNIRKVKMLDSRSPQEYYGIKKSNAIEALGHIPHAMSSYYNDKFLTDQTLREQKELDDIFIHGHELNKEDEIIIYAENIFTASMNWFILYKKMGFTNTKIYENSFLEWGNNPQLQVIKFKWE
ncbi:thiosulfate sulfurtransferase [bacterium]|nr:thiosulfate sulfurtransferase [bacterium]MBU1993481.1 thiosulfate sulfurtransferase [bacterium]